MIYYTLEKNNGLWVVWKNVEKEKSYGSCSVFKSIYRQECRDFCKENNIKLKKAS